MIVLLDPEELKHSVGITAEGNLHLGGVLIRTEKHTTRRDNAEYVRTLAREIAMAADKFIEDIHRNVDLTEVNQALAQVQALQQAVKQTTQQEEETV